MSRRGDGFTGPLPPGKPLTREQQAEAWAAYRAAPRDVWLIGGGHVKRAKAAETAAARQAGHDRLVEVIAAKNAERAGGGL